MFVPDENGRLLGQHPRIKGKWKIAKFGIFGAWSSVVAVIPQ